MVIRAAWLKNRRMEMKTRKSAVGILHLSPDLESQDIKMNFKKQMKRRKALEKKTNRTIYQRKRNQYSRVLKFCPRKANKKIENTLQSSDTLTNILGKAGQ